MVSPITLTQISNGISYGLKRDYMPKEDLSHNVQLAAIASEDQRFPDYCGFDKEAIAKSMQPKKGKNRNFN